MRETLFVLSISLPVILFELFCLIGSFSYKKEYQKKYDFLTSFPYELFRDEKSDNKFLIKVLYDSFAASLMILVIFQIFIHYQSGTLVSFILMGGLFALALAITLIMLAETPASKEKPHTTLAVLSMAFLALFSFSNGIFLFAVSKGYEFEVAMKAMGALCFLVTVISLILLINPKLKNWPELESISEKDGSVSFRRPRPFVLAVTEWMTIFLSVLLVAFAAIGNLLAIL